MFSACCFSRAAMDDEQPPRPVPSSLFPPDPLSAWITTEEAGKIREVRAALTRQEQESLDRAPEDIRHDLMLCRFLRGHDGAVSGALKALRAHLKYRSEFGDTIAKARALLPAGAEDFRVERTLHGSEVGRYFLQEQLPPWEGTNDGMAVSFLVARLFDLGFLCSAPADLLRHWFISCLEQRSFTLHNQSMRERRMARVMEGRDCNGFSFLQFLSPRVIQRANYVFQDGIFYPELLGRLHCFNLAPGSPAMSIIKRLMGSKMQEKVIFADRGDWRSAVGLPGSLSPVMLPRWTKHLQQHACVDGWQRLSRSLPSAFSARAVAAGETFFWRVECASVASNRVFQHHASQGTEAVRVSMFFFKPKDHRQLQQGGERCCEDAFLDWAACSHGYLHAPAEGIVMLQVSLERFTCDVDVSIGLSEKEKLAIPNKSEVSHSSDLPTLLGWKRTSKLSTWGAVVAAMCSLLAVCCAIEKVSCSLPWSYVAVAIHGIWYFPA